nr:immunoglobulin heavy chain junction region [Mus musculus]
CARELWGYFDVW